MNPASGFLAFFAHCTGDTRTSWPGFSAMHTFAWFRVQNRYEGAWDTN